MYEITEAIILHKNNTSKVTIKGYFKSVDEITEYEKIVKKTMQYYLNEKVNLFVHYRIPSNQHIKWI